MIACYGAMPKNNNHVSCRHEVKMFPPPIPIKRCPRCLARLDGRTAVCPNCKKKLLKKRGPVYLAQQISLVLIVTGLAVIIVTVYFLTLIDLASLALLFGGAGLSLLLAGILVRWFIKQI